jgi:WD40 repeat protein
MAEGGLRIVDMRSGLEEALLIGPRDRMARATFSRDGRRIVTVEANSVLRLWDADSGRLLTTWSGEGGCIGGVTFSGDGSRFAFRVSLGKRRQDRFLVYASADGRQLSAVEAPAGLTGDEPLIALSPDGSRLVTSAHECDLHEWDAASGGPLGDLRGHAAIVKAVAFSPDGGRMASGAANGHIRLWDPTTRTLERELMGHCDGVMSLAFSGDGCALASGGSDGTVRIWPLAIAAPMAVLAGVAGMNAVEFSPDGTQLAVAPKGTDHVELWSPRTVRRLRTLVGGSGTVAQLAYSPDGLRVAAAFATPQQTGGVRVWSTQTGALLSTCGGRSAAAHMVTFSPDGTRLLIGSGRSSPATHEDAACRSWVMTWDLRSDSPLMSAEDGRITSLPTTAAVFGLGGTRVACRAGHLLDAATGESTAKLPPLGMFGCLGASPDGSVLGIGLASGNVCLASFATGAQIAQLNGHVGCVRAIAFSSDGTRIMTGSLDGTARLWDARSGESIHVLHGHEGIVERTIFSPDGSRAVTAGTDGTVRIWDTNTGQEVSQLPGQRAEPTAVALSPDGTLVVTAADDGTARIWGLSNAAIAAARHAETTDSEAVTGR